MNRKTCLKVYEEEFQKESKKAPGLLTSGGYQRLQGVIVAAMQRAHELGRNATSTPST